VESERICPKAFYSLLQKVKGWLGQERDTKKGNNNPGSHEDIELKEYVS